ncbi:malectin domain-containing carbohydrate-binding protein [Pontibacter russatus]|uniref:malectin domain-containing carbohydrate-binding protein n=1 Tax=Pontibacter russatus TaxID=2694929 RepID=UPI00137B7B11|nr:malectin domain-containing carbohydrate-binding protein [Pontibacter russatus]
MKEEYVAFLVVLNSIRQKMEILVLGMVGSLILTLGTILPPGQAVAAGANGTGVFAMGHAGFLARSFTGYTVYAFPGFREAFLKALMIQSSSSNAYMVVENLDKFPAPDRFVASRIQIPWRRTNSDGTYTPYNANHDKLRLKISNRGTGTLTISNLTLSNTAAWRIVSLNGTAYNSSTSLPRSLGTGASLEVVIAFVAKDLGGRVKILNDRLTIASNDASAPAKEVKLHGLWQYRGEGNNEPYAVEVIRALGFMSRTGFASNDGVIDGSSLVPNSDEILSAFFVRADPSRPVTVVQMAAYHGCCSFTERFQWYSKGTSTINTLFTHNSLDGQSLLPRRSGSSTEVAAGTFSASGAFGFRVASAYSDRTRNYKGKIGMRIWKAIDANGNVIPNAYIIGGDYLGTQYTNYDYQDNIYYVGNLKPEAGSAHYSELAAAPSAVSFGSLLTGGSKSMSVNLKNSGKTYSSGNDPSILIKGVEVVGPGKAEFSATAPSTTTLGPQSSTNIAVSFRPSSQGIKNAALLVHYNSAASPLRILLYGIANSSSFTITAAKRIKGASDASKTIAGVVWEADVNYRKGSIKLDKQLVTTAIAATEDDVLYQTYLSASTDLAETRYEIPIANGSYYVRMHFVENYFTAVGARVFSISIENQLRLSGFDIYREAGYRAALVKDFTVNVTDGMLHIKFNPTVNRVAIAGVEIFRAPSGAKLAASNSSALEAVAVGHKAQLKVYPNPSKGGKVQVELSGFAGRETTLVTLYDMAGRHLQTKVLLTDDEGAASTELLSGRQANPGMYLVKAQATSGRAEFYLIIE